MRATTSLSLLKRESYSQKAVNPASIISGVISISVSPSVAFAMQVIVNQTHSAQ
jgi:hypothetical protein